MTKTERDKFKPGVAVFLFPKKQEDGHFAEGMMVITQIKSWGAVGYMVNRRNPTGRAYYRAEWDEMGYAGPVVGWSDCLPVDFKPPPWVR